MLIVERHPPKDTEWLISSVDRELSTLTDILRQPGHDAIHRKGIRNVLLELSARRIQSAFRSAQKRRLGVPAPLWPLMGRTPRAAPGRFCFERVLPRRTLSWILTVIPLLYVEKMRADAQCDRDLSPRSSLCGFIYDFYLNKIGVRCVAEVRVRVCRGRVELYWSSTQIL